MATLVDLTPPRVDVRIVAGDTLTFSLTVRDSDGGPFILTGTLAAQARRTFRDETAVDFTVTANANVATLTLDAAETADMVGGWVWDVDYTDTDGVRTLAAGLLTVAPEVTRD
jgi:hypothetical protein